MIGLLYQSLSGRQWQGCEVFCCCCFLVGGTLEFSWGLIFHKNTNLDSKQTWLICCPKGQAFSEFLTVAPVKKQKPASQKTHDALEYFWSFMRYSEQVIGGKKKKKKISAALKCCCSSYSRYEKGSLSVYFHLLLKNAHLVPKCFKMIFN